MLPAVAEDSRRSPRTITVMTGSMTFLEFLSVADIPVVTGFMDICHLCADLGVG
jgi:hypothetical protein